MFDAIATGIADDLNHELSTIQKHLIEAFASAACRVHDINARLLKGEKVDIWLTVRPSVQWCVLLHSCQRDVSFAT
jgi:hypothetical protein